MSTTTLRRKTIADLRAMPDDGRIYELIRGEIVVAAAPSETHMEAEFALLYLLTTLERVHQLGKLYFAPFEIHLPTGDVVEPDLFFLKTEKWWMRRGSHVEGSPDLAMEIVSPSSRRRDHVEKHQIYEAAGVEEYWIVDVERRSIEALTLRDGQYVRIPQIGTVLRSVVLPLLDVDVEALFGSLSFGVPAAE